MQKAIIILAILLTGFSSFVYGQTPVYGLEGWGAATIGGQGGRLIRVTNLNASGVGSLKDALTQTGNRVIVFEVGGTINLYGSTLSIKHPHVTIAGQTAPSPGVNLINGSISIQTHDVILQHIRMRVGAANKVNGWEPDGISTYIANNIIIDHCSVTWAVDENCSASGPRFDGSTPNEWRMNTSHDITISNCIIAEGLSNATHSKGEHSKGSLIHDNVTNIAILKNLYVSNKDRNPLFKGGARGIIVNNYIYNPGDAAIKFGLADSEWAGYEWQEAQMTIVGNVLQYGSNTSNIPLVKAGNGPCAVFLEDNQAKNVLGNSVSIYSGDSSNLTNVKPTWNDNIFLLSSEKIKDYLVNQAGARAWDRDVVDNRLVNEVTQGLGQIIDLETEVGGFPNLTATTNSFNENDWNLDFMIEKTDLAYVETNKETYLNNETILVNANIDNFSGDIEYLDLLLNGVSIERINKSPFIWSFSHETVGDSKLQIIIKETNGRLKILNPKTITITDALNTNSISSLQVSIYPNPFTNFIKLSFSKMPPQTIHFELRNLLGQTIKTDSFYLNSSSKEEYKIDTSNLVANVYYLTLKIKKTSIVNRILVLNR